MPRRATPVIFAVVALAVAGCAQPDQNSGRPNILLIVADDLGYSDIGAFGGEVSTPALDALAAEGLRFSNFHVLPTCSPTRSVLLSGVDNHVAGLGTMGEALTPEMEGQPGYEGYLNFQVAALPEILREGGYRTYMSGKWHLGHEPEHIPSARGFEESFALIPGGGSHWSDRRQLSPIQPVIYRRNGELVEELPDDFYSTEYYTDTLLDWLQRDRSDTRPFFAYLAYTAPHDPLHAPQEYIDKYKGAYDQGWDVLRQERLAALKEFGAVPEDAVPFPRLASVPAWEELSPEARQVAARDMEVYAAMVDYMDEQIQRVLDQLRSTGEYDNTLIIFMSDNGANGAMPTAYPGQTQEFLASFDNSLENRGLPDSYIETGPGWAQASMAPSRMFKGFVSEGGVRAPLVVKFPGTTLGPAAMNHSFFHVRDILPTLLEAAALEAPSQMGGREVVAPQGSSVLGMFAGEVQTPYAAAAEVGYEMFGLRSYFVGSWKILWMPPPFGPGEWQLYDLSQDPGETNDLAEDFPGRVADMIARWEQYKVDNGVLDAASMDLSGVG
jgi:arylsulfatase A-like enzyme